MLLGLRIQLVLVIATLTALNSYCAQCRSSARALRRPRSFSCSATSSVRVLLLPIARVGANEADAASCALARSPDVHLRGDAAPGSASQPSGTRAPLHPAQETGWPELAPARVRSLTLPFALVFADDN